MERSRSMEAAKLMENHDFDSGILDEAGHRPWPMPNAPWIMTQTWHDLLFAHWPVDKDRLATLVPSPLELDLYDGEAWLGIVPFRMTNVAPRGVPSLPWVSAFPELNVRTYVRVGDKPGVYFLSLDAGNPIAVATARALFGLPYYNAEMEVERDDETIRYRSRRTTMHAPPAELVMSYQPAGGVFQAERGSRDYFFTERYCLYTVEDNGHAKRLQIHHRPWPLQPASGVVKSNTMADAAGLQLPSRAPLLHFVKRQDIVAWPLEPAAG
jgi:uncharacterized protein YqjF (DUF2071 family)